MVLTSESLAANITGVRSLISMCSLMDEQIVGLGEFSIAVFTDELFLGSTGWGAGCGAWGAGSAWRVGSGRSPYIGRVRHGHGTTWETPSGVLVAVQSTTDPLVHEECGIVERHALEILLGVVWCREILVGLGGFEVFHFVGRCDLSESRMSGCGRVSVTTPRHNLLFQQLLTPQLL